MVFLLKQILRHVQFLKLLFLATPSYLGVRMILGQMRFRIFRVEKSHHADVEEAPGQGLQHFFFLARVVFWGSRLFFSMQVVVFGGRDIFYNIFGTFFETF